MSKKNTRYKARKANSGNRLRSPNSTKSRRSRLKYEYPPHAFDNMLSDTVISIEQCIAETLELNRMDTDALTSVVHQYEMIMLQALASMMDPEDHDHPDGRFVDVGDLGWPGG